MSSPWYPRWGAALQCSGCRRAFARRLSCLILKRRAEARRQAKMPDPTFPARHPLGIRLFAPRQRLTCEVRFTFKREAIFVAVFFSAQLLLGLLLALLVPR